MMNSVIIGADDQCVRCYFLGDDWHDCECFSEKGTIILDKIAIPKSVV